MTTVQTTEVHLIVKTCTCVWYNNFKKYYFQGHLSYSIKWHDIHINSALTEFSVWNKKPKTLLYAEIREIISDQMDWEVYIMHTNKSVNCKIVNFYLLSAFQYTVDINM